MIPSSLRHFRPASGDGQENSAQWHGMSRNLSHTAEHLPDGSSGLLFVEISFHKPDHPGAGFRP